MPTSLTYLVLSTRGCSPWRPDAVISTTGGALTLSLGFSRTVEEAPDGADVRRFPSRTQPSRRLSRFQGHRLLTRKENSSQAPRRRLRVRSRRRIPLLVHPRPGAGILTRFPFGLAGRSRAAVARRTPRRLYTRGFLRPLRLGSPVSNCCSHGTLLHFSLQSSHLNTCYYHQDLH